MNRRLKVMLETIVARFREVKNLYDLVMEGYERTDDKKARVRTSEVGTFIGQRLGLEADDPWVRRAVIEAMKEHGVKVVNVKGVRQYVGLKRREKA